MNSPDFSIQMIDKYNNIYTVTNSGNQIFLNSNADVIDYDVNDIYLPILLLDLMGVIHS